MVKWLREIARREAYIILSTGRIIETLPGALRFPKNRIVHKLTTVEERQIAANLLGLREHAPGIHFQKRRHRLYQVTYPSNLEFGEAIFLREDYAYPFTIKINYSNLYIQAALKVLNEANKNYRQHCQWTGKQFQLDRVHKL